MQIRVTKDDIKMNHKIFNSKVKTKNKANILLLGIKGNGFFFQCLLYHRGAAHTFPNS